MFKKTLLMILILVFCTVSVDAFFLNRKPEAPPPIVINNNTNLSIGSLNMSGDIYMNNYTIWSPVLVNATLVSFITLYVNNSFEVEENLTVGGNLSVGDSICLNSTCIDDWTDIPPYPISYSGTLTVTGGVGSVSLSNLNVGATNVKINRTVTDNFFNAKIYNTATGDRLVWMQSKSFHNGTALSNPAGKLYDDISINITDADEDGTYSYLIEGEYYG